MKPIPRAKADKLFAEFLKRVEQVNADDELTHYVHEVWLFGSYAGHRKDVGDIDLAVDMRPREIEGRDIVEQTKKRARASGRRFSSFIEILNYGEKEVDRLLGGAALTSAYTQCANSRPWGLRGS